MQVFQVDFGYDNDSRPTLDEKPSPVDCRRCMGRAPSPLACPDHQFALSERQMQLLWKHWVPDMDPINPVDHGYDDAWDLPGTFEYYDHFGVNLYCVSAGLGIVCFVYVYPPLCV